MSALTDRLAFVAQLFTRRSRTPRELGAIGESRAAWHYRWRGWRIVERNFRSGDGEIDLIARRGRTISFVEVKTRDGTEMGEPFEAVDRAKQLRIAAIARRYLSAKKLDELTVRFDVASLVWDGRRFTLRLFADAFRPEADPRKPWKWR